MNLSTRLLRYYSRPHSEAVEYLGLLFGEFMLRQKEHDLKRFESFVEQASLDKGRYDVLVTMIARRVNEK